MDKTQLQYLNELVASFGVLYTKLHQHHWFITGNRFFVLHETFEEYYDEVTGNLDDVAERILQLGGEPVSTLKEFLELSIIEEAPYSKASETDMVKSVIEDFKILDKKYQAGFDVFEGDEVTVDILVGLQAAVQKHIWMLEAYLG